MSFFDIRWHQRLDNYLKALARLQDAASTCQTREASDLEKYGLIQCFEFVHELSWNVMKNYFEYQGNTTITDFRDAVREAFQKGLIDNKENWLEINISYTQTLLSYEENILTYLANRICEAHYLLFQEFANKMILLKEQAHGIHPI